MKIKASILLNETLEKCSNVTLFFINDGKVIGTSYFDKIGCNIKVINPDYKDIHFTLMTQNGLYEIVGSLKNLKMNKLGEVNIVDNKLIYNAINFIKKEDIHCEHYKEDITDIVDRKLGIEHELILKI